MKAKHLILTLSLALAASATVAAIKHGHVELSKAALAPESTTGAIPRVVVTASRAQAKALAESYDAQVRRVVLTAPRHAAH